MIQIFSADERLAGRPDGRRVGPPEGVQAVFADLKSNICCNFFVKIHKSSLKSKRYEELVTVKNGHPLLDEYR